MWRTLLLAAAVAVAATAAEADEPEAGRRLLLVRRRGAGAGAGGRWGRAAAPSEGSSPFVVLPDASSASQPFTVRSIPLLLVEEADAQGNPQITPLVDGSDSSGSEVPVIYATPALLGRRGFVNRRGFGGDSADAPQVSEPRRALKNGDVDINIRVRPYSIFPNPIFPVRDTDIPVIKPDVRDDADDDYIGELGITETTFGKRFRKAIATINAEKAEEYGGVQSDNYISDNRLYNTYVPESDMDVESEMNIEDAFRDMDPWLTWRDEEPLPLDPVRDMEREVVVEPSRELELPREDLELLEPSRELEPPRKDLEILEPSRELEPPREDLPKRFVKRVPFSIWRMLPERFY